MINDINECRKKENPKRIDYCTKDQIQFFINEKYGDDVKFIRKRNGVFVYKKSGEPVDVLYNDTKIKVIENKYRIGEYVYIVQDKDHTSTNYIYYGKIIEIRKYEEEIWYVVHTEGFGILANINVPEHLTFKTLAETKKYIKTHIDDFFVIAGLVEKVKDKNE